MGAAQSSAGLRHARSRSSGELAALSSNRGNPGWGGSGRLNTKRLLDGIGEGDDDDLKKLLEDGPPHTRSWPGLMLWLLTAGLLTALYFFTYRRCARGHWASVCHALHMDRGYHWVSLHKVFEERDEYQCNAALGFPRVALLFQSAGDMPHERLWRAWLGGVVGLIPLAPDGAQRQGCAEETLTSVKLACLIRPTDTVIQRQHLFTVYVHPSKSFEGFDRKSIFYGHELQDRIETSNNPTALVDVARMLLTEALKVPHNQQFLLLSDACVPLYLPQVVWQQLVSEDKSRINTCRGKHVDYHFFPQFMGNDTILKQEHWRKSPQWFGLRREHAEVVVHDQDFLDVMREYCVADQMIDGRWYVCYIDEHYVPSLLVYKEVGGPNNTDCHGGLVTANWSQVNTPQPHSYAPEEVTPDLLANLRRDAYFSLKPLQYSRFCDGARAVKMARQGFVRPTDLYSKSCSPAYRWSGDLLNIKCPLFARKFGNDTAGVLLDTLQRCGENRLHVLPPAC